MYPSRKTYQSITATSARDCQLASKVYIYLTWHCATSAATSAQVQLSNLLQHMVEVARTLCLPRRHTSVAQCNPTCTLVVCAQVTSRALEVVLVVHKVAVQLDAIRRHLCSLLLRPVEPLIVDQSLAELAQPLKPRNRALHLAVRQHGVRLRHPKQRQEQAAVPTLGTHRILNRERAKCFSVE